MDIYYDWQTNWTQTNLKFKSKLGFCLFQILQYTFRNTTESDPIMDTTETKITVIILLGVIKFCFGIAPLSLRRRLKRSSGGGWWMRKFIGNNFYFWLQPFILFGNNSQISPGSKGQFQSTDQRQKPLWDTCSLESNSSTSLILT